MSEIQLRAHGAVARDGPIGFYGVHHLALNTDDMKMRVDFCVGVLGMRLVHAMKVPPGLGAGPGNRGNPPFEEIRHYFFDMGRDGLLAFFEMPKGAKERGDRNALGVIDPNDIRLEFSCQPGNGEAEPCIVPQVTQTRTEALAELMTLTGDKEWLNRAMAGLRD